MKFVTDLGCIMNTRMVASGFHHCSLVQLAITTKCRTVVDSAVSYDVTLPIPVAVRSKAWVYGRSHAVIAGSNPAGSMGVCLL